MRDDPRNRRAPDGESGWLIVRRDGTIVTAERRASALIGAPDSDALLGRDWTSFVAHEDGPVLPDARHAVLAGAAWSGHLRYQYGHGRVALHTTVGAVSRSPDLMVVTLTESGRAPAPQAHEAYEPYEAAPEHRAPPRPSMPGASFPHSDAPVTPSPAPRPPPPRPPEPEPAHLTAHLAAHEALQDLPEAGAAARAVLQALLGAVPFEWGAVLRFPSPDPAHASVEVVAAYPSPMAGVGAGARWSPLSPGEDAARTLGQPRIEADLGSGGGFPGGDPSPLARLPGFGLRSRLILPLFAGSGVSGLVVLYRGGVDAFDAHEGILAERTVRRLGEALRAPAPPSAAREAAPAEPPRPAPEPPRFEEAPRIEEAPTVEPAPETAPPRPSFIGTTSTESGVPASRLESLGELVAGVAHELNNPLTAILGYAQILGGLEESERDHALRTIEAEAQRAGRIVRNLLAFARQRPSERRMVDLETVLRRIIDLRRYSLEVDNVRVVTRFGHVPEVRADEGQMEQVFLNLLSNAHQVLKGPGGPGGEVTVSTWARDRHVYVSFADTGPGVPPEMRSRIFEPFFTTRSVGAGEGMGLSTVYGVVTHHGGRTWVEPSPSGGANFILELPIEADHAPGDPATPALDAGAEGGGRPRVLVVDDEAPVRALMQEILTTAGYDVVTAEDGRQALRRLEAADFALVLTDVRMPVMGGVELFQEARQRLPQMASRIVFVTGDIEGDRSGATLDLEEVRYLEKPFTRQELLDAVEGALLR